LYQETFPARRRDDDRVLPCLSNSSDLENLSEDIVCGRTDPTLPYFSPDGAFYHGRADQPIELSSEACKWAGGRSLHLGVDFRTLAIIPIVINGGDTGLLILKSKQGNFLVRLDLTQYEHIARVLGIAVAHRRAQVALRERVKELTCLYGLAKLTAEASLSLPELLQRTAELLPPSWLHPEVAVAQIRFDKGTYATGDFEQVLQKQRADITVDNRTRGVVEVGYVQETRVLDEGPFLKEERNLINAVAQELGHLIESRQMEDESAALHEQLRHADRLATIGQLAAGVAHELNEPLAGILGFAQLIEKAPDLPDQVSKDCRKIVAASLHARGVIQKLNLFSRQARPSVGGTELNRIVEDGLFFLESRCAKADIELVKVLQPDVPVIQADPGQLQQVLINLVVNAVQATAPGGRIIVRTVHTDDIVVLRVEDTGAGMEDEVLKKIFDPFFTTKEVNEGTGLGLAVVHGIVSSHGGTIDVESEVGKGSSFEVKLPLSTSIVDEALKE
jgi:signal transduction histidine kinase